VKIRKNCHKTVQNWFRIFPLKFLNPLAQYNSNGTPFETVGSISTSNRRFKILKNVRNHQKFFLQKTHLKSYNAVLYAWNAQKNIVSNLSTLLLHNVPIVLGTFHYTWKNCIAIISVCLTIKCTARKRLEGKIYRMFPLKSGFFTLSNF